MKEHLIDGLKVWAANGATFATVSLTEIHTVLKVLLTGATLVYTAVKIVQAIKGEKNEKN